MSRYKQRLPSKKTKIFKKKKMPRSRGPPVIIICRENKRDNYTVRK